MHNGVMYMCTVLCVCRICIQLPKQVCMEQHSQLAAELDHVEEYYGFSLHLHTATH